MCHTCNKDKLREIAVLSSDLGKGWKEKWQQSDSHLKRTYPPRPERGQGEPCTTTFAPLCHNAAVWPPERGNLQEHRWKTEIKDSIGYTYSDIKEYS